MSKEIDWNTVETVWDYADKVDQDIFVALFKNNKKDYIKYLKKDARTKYQKNLREAWEKNLQKYSYFNVIRIKG